MKALEKRIKENQKANWPLLSNIIRKDTEQRIKKKQEQEAKLKK